MCAVVQSERTKRRIIIIDSDKHVALWIAAVSCMLPPTYRPLLSFATYHHDPYQSWFLITGTIDDSTFRSTSEESISHFVLDGRTRKTSPVEESQYAKLVRTYAYPERYDKYMLRYFLIHEQRFPKPTCIDEQLDLFATYLSLLKQKGTISVSDMLLAVKIVLTTFEKLASYSDEDRKELAHLKDVLEDAREKSRSPNVQKAYDRVVRLYQKHNIPTEELFKNSLRYCTEMLLEDPPKGEPEEAVTLLKQLHETYNDDVFIKYVNHPDYLQYVVGVIQNSYNDKLCLIWKHIGPYLLPDSQSPDSPNRKLFLRSIRIWDSLQQNKFLSKANELFSLIKSTMEGKELKWLQLLVDSTTLPTDMLVDRFYWQLVSALSFEQREQYRTIVQRVVPTIADYEFQKELSASELQSKMAVINRWVAYNTSSSAIKTPRSIVSEGLDALRQQCNKFQWEKLTFDVLMNDDLLPLLGQKEDMLVEETLSELTLQQFSPRYIKLYKRYKVHHALPMRSKDVLAGMIAMSDGHLDDMVSERLYNYISCLASGEVYFGEINGFISEFLNKDITEEDHLLMVSALFVRKYEEHFWLSYWEKVRVMLTRLLTNDLERAVRLFSFWFAFLPGKVSRLDQCYVVHQFFLGLKHRMNDGQILQVYSKALDNLGGKASSYTWYPLIEELLQTRKKNFIEKGQYLVRGVQKWLPSQKPDEQAQEAERKIDEAISSLLAQGTICEQHIQNIPTLCRNSSREAFWSAYQEHLVQILTGKANNVDHIVEILSFWFDQSFNYLGREPYIAQEFFIKLFQIFDVARKERESGFRKTAEQMISRCEQPASRGEGFTWYLLIRTFFVEALSSRRGLR